MSEAGSSRRILIRVIGAPLLVAALAGVVYLDYRLGKPLAVTAVIAVFAIVSYRELCAMAQIRGMRPARELGSLALLVIFGSIFWSFIAGVPSGLPEGLILGWLLAVLILVVVRYGRFTPFDAAYSFLGVAYVALMAFAVRLPGEPSVDQRMLYLAFLVATNKGSDMAAFSVGKLIGRHKMVPVVSPNKTWEGALAGLVVGAGAGVSLVQLTALAGFVGSPSLGATIAFAVAVTVAAQLGDLVKSAFKRWAGIKDSGRLLPEFGGALDMCDSFILSAPVAWVGLRLFW